MNREVLAVLGSAQFLMVLAASWAASPEPVSRWARSSVAVTTYLTWRLVFIGEVVVAIAILVGLLATSLSASVMVDDRVSEPVEAQVGIALDSGISLVTTERAATALADAGVPADESAVIVDHYADAQLRALKTGLLVAALIVLLSFVFTARLPKDPLGGGEGEPAPGPDTAGAGGPDPTSAPV